MHDGLHTRVHGFYARVIDAATIDRSSVQRKGAVRRASTFGCVLVDAVYSPVGLV